MSRRAWWIWLAILTIIAIPTNAAASDYWEIKVTHSAGYVGRAVENGLRVVQVGQSEEGPTYAYQAAGADTEDLTAFHPVVTLRISNSKNSADIVGYLWAFTVFTSSYKEIGRITIHKSDGNKCVAFYGTAFNPSFERC